MDLTAKNAGQCLAETPFFFHYSHLCPAENPTDSNRAGTGLVPYTWFRKLFVGSAECPRFRGTVYGISSGNRISLKLDARTLAHFSVSSMMSLPKSAGAGEQRSTKIG